MASGRGDPYFPASVASNGPELVEGHSVCLHSTRRLAVGLLMASGRGDPYFPGSGASNGPELVEGAFRLFTFDAPLACSWLRPKRFLPMNLQQTARRMAPSLSRGIPFVYILR